MPTRTRSDPRRLAAGVAAALTLLLPGCAADVPAPGPPPDAPAPTVQAPPPAPGLAESKPTRIRIPALAVDAALVELGLQPDGTMEVPADGTVAGWYTGAPTPGELGPAVIAAHVDWKGAPGVFARLHALQPGTDVAVQRADGTTALFRVRHVEQYAKDRFPTEAVYGDLDHAGLRLITCGGEFDEEARSYRDNVVVYAELANRA
ncbi:class F sortase [Pseudonocardia nigra]|uniref:class F sortase n=1 Tax=Pseudonocardia nigra TaxID=1921578 RepID=UPI001C5FB41D|nr:class F sortase [Pseudonocardia nigra]